MNILDIIILSLLAFAVYGGFRDGIIVQLCSIAGIVLGLYLSSRYDIEAAKLLGITGKYKEIWGYIIVMLTTLVVVSLAGHTARKLIRFVGLGPFDIIFGVALSLCKYLLIMSILFSVFDMVNTSYKLIDTEMLSQSMLYRPIVNITSLITPIWEEFTMQI